MKKQRTSINVQWHGLIDETDVFVWLAPKTDPSYRLYGNITRSSLFRLKRALINAHVDTIHTSFNL